jgi:hypothetical protein
MLLRRYPGYISHGTQRSHPMDFIDRIREIAARIPKQLEYIQTEEATKSALVMPFIAALGYNVFDPSEVTPELNADVGLKKGEKVDYAILRDNKPIMLFECKHHAADLNKVHASQLYRYFSVTEARFAVLTNGLVYWFYTDLEAANKIDARPFFEFNVLDVREQDTEELKKFSKSAFDLNNIITTASELKYTREIKRILLEQMQEPTEDFVKFFATQVYTGKMTQKVREQFAELTRQALKHLINDQINERLKTALATDASAVGEKPTEALATPTTPTNLEDVIVTTEEELDAFYIIRAILREIVPSGSRLVDSTSPCQPLRFVERFQATRLVTCGSACSTAALAASASWPAVWLSRSIRDRKRPFGCNPR